MQKALDFFSQCNLALSIDTDIYIERERNNLQRFFFCTCASKLFIQLKCNHLFLNYCIFKIVKFKMLFSY